MGCAHPHQTLQPHTNGKAERVIQTSLRERVYAQFTPPRRRVRTLSPTGWATTTAHRNTHLSLKKRGFVDRGAIPWGVSGSAARFP